MRHFAAISFNIIRIRISWECWLRHETGFFLSLFMENECHTSTHHSHSLTISENLHILIIIIIIIGSSPVIDWHITHTAHSSLHRQLITENEINVQLRQMNFNKSVHDRSATIYYLFVWHLISTYVIQCRVILQNS